MHRLLRLLPALFAAYVVVFLGVAVTVGLPDPAWRWTVPVVGLVGAVGIWHNEIPRVFAAVIFAASVRLATLDLPSDAAHSSPIAASLLDLLVGIGLCFLILAAIQRRYGRVTASDGLDIVAVAIGTGLIAWIAIVNPLIDAGAGTTSVTLDAAFLPLAALILTLSVDVTWSGLQRNTTMRLVTLAATANLAGAWLSALGAAGRIGRIDDQPTYVLFVVALCSVAAAFSHADAPAALTATRSAAHGAEGLPRLFAMGVSVVLPIGVVAAVAPTSSTDTAVRTIGVVALIVAIVIRLTIATNQNRSTRETLLQQLTNDELTQLPTRTRFADEVDEILERAWHSPQRPTVVQINLDRFKNVNDSFGRYTADEVLRTLADRLRRFGTGRDEVVARVGGDDFALVVGTTTSAEEALAQAEAVRDIIAPVVTVGDASVFLTASIGVAIAPRNRTITSEALMRQADIATHQAKQEGRNRISIFDESMQARVTRRMDVEHALHGAIGRQEMRLYHQPIVDITTGRLSGFEALMRWQRQDGTIVSPGDFIPVAEDTGIICELGAWALLDALQELRNWIDDGVVGPSVTMSVNASPRQIADPAFPSIVRHAIEESGVSPHLLWIEITESMMLDEPEIAQRTLAEIRAMGVRIALDDFGTGFSSLSILQQFPIQRIKIDRAFVQGIADSTNDRSLVRTVIAMAQSMALDLVAEGVETIQQLESLRELGCEKAQGFLISRPVPADAMRTTMSAIDELAGLSLFTAQRSDPVHQPQPVTARQNVYAHEPLGPSYAGVGPMMPLSSRPLGGPRL